MTKERVVEKMTRRNDVMLEKTKCPICNYRISSCQCRFSGSAHPDRHKKREVVLDHLYLFSEEQIKHIIALERDCQVSYGDAERSNILKQLVNEQGENLQREMCS